MHQEKFIGDRQYWLTRPFTWRDILIAKFSFILAFILLPLFIGQMAVLIWLGFPIFGSLPALLMKDLLFASIWILPAAALAVITRNLAQMVLAAIACFILLRILSPVFPSPLSWNEFDWVRESLSLAILIFGSISVLLIQHISRRTRVSRIWMAMILAIAFLSLISPPASWIFSFQSLFSSRRIDNTAVRFVPDSTSIHTSYNMISGS
jgi:ABC-type transport system involved in multi-copper enzyme maturation permease subunit